MTGARASRPAGLDLASAEAAIRLLVDRAIQFQSDVDAFLGLHSDDIVIVNLAGQRVIGKAASMTAMTEGLRTKLANVLTHNEIVRAGADQLPTCESKLSLLEC